MSDKIVITTAGISGSSGAVAITGSFLVTGSEGLIELSGSGTALSGAHGSSTTTSGSTTFTDAGGSSTSTSATGSIISGSGGSVAHGSGSSIYADAGGSTSSTSASGSFISGSGGSTSTTSGSTSYTDAGGSSTTTSATGSVSTGSAGSATHGSGSSTYTDADGTHSTSATGSFTTGSSAAASHGSGSSIYSSADGTYETSATGSFTSGSTPGTTTSTAGSTTHEDTDSTTIHSPSGSHYSGSAGSTTITDGTVEITGSIIVSGSSPAITIMAGELIVSGSSVLGSTIDHTTTIDSHLTASYGLVAPTHGISGAYVTAYDGRFPGHVSSSLYKGSMVSASLLVTGGQVKAHRGTFGLMVTEFLTMSMGALVEDDDKVHFGTAQESHIRYDEAGQDFLTISGSDAGGLVLSGSSLVLDSDTVESGSRAGGGSFLAVSTTGKVVLATPDGGSGGGGAVSAVANGANDRVATFSSGDALNGEANLTFDGNTLTVGGLGVVTGSQLLAFGVTGTLGTFSTVSASLLKGFRHDGYEFSGSSGQFATLSGSATTVHTLNDLTTTEIALLDGASAGSIANGKAVIYSNAGGITANVITASSYQGFAVRTTHGEHAGTVSASVFIGSNVSASTEITGGLHKGHTGKFDILSASTVHAHVFSPSTVSASTEITGGALSVFGVTGTLGTFFGLLSASSIHAFSHIGSEAVYTGFVEAGTYVSASTNLTGGHLYAFGITGSKATIPNISATEVTSSVLLAFSHTGDEFIAHNNVSASQFLTGGHVYAFGVTGALGTFSGLLSASSVHAFSHLGDEGVYTRLSGSAATLHNITLNNVAITSNAGEINLLDGAQAETIVNSKAVIYGNVGEVTGSRFKGFATVTNEASASRFDGFRHNGYEFSGSSGFFAIMSASTFSTHVFAPTTVSASSGQFATLSGSATTVHTLNGLTTTEIGLLDGASAGSIVASKAVIYDAVGKVTASQVEAFGITGSKATITNISATEATASVLLAFSHTGDEFIAHNSVSASTEITGGAVSAFGITGTLGTFFGLLSASSVHGFSHVGGEAVYTGFVEAGTTMSASQHFSGGHVYAFGLTGSQATLTHAAATPPTPETAQLKLSYDAANFAFIGVDSVGSTSIESTALSARQKGVDLLPANTSHGEIVFFGTEDPNDSLAIGKLMYLATGGIWKHADADAVASCGGVLLGIALGTAVSDGFLLKGYANISGTFGGPLTKLTHGAALYVSTIPAEMTQTQPTASGDTSRVIGYAVSSSGGKTIYFNPDSTYIEQ